MTPDQVKACSIWEFDAAVAGWAATHAPAPEGKLSEDDADDLWEIVKV